MKDKEKQIESKALTLGNELYCKQDKFDMSNPYEVAEAVIELGYQKIPEDSVVLSREEYDTLKTENDKYVKDCINYLATINKLENKVWEVEQQSSKETAEKFLQLAYDRCLEKSFIKKVEELAKSLGVELKE